MIPKSGKYSYAVAAAQFHKKERDRESVKTEEITLKELGKFSAFKEVFEQISLKDQDFSYLNINGEIITNPNFIEGRKFGFVLIKNGFSEEKYYEYIKATESKKHR